MSIVPEWAHSATGVYHWLFKINDVQLHKTEKRQLQKTVKRQLNKKLARHKDLFYVHSNGNVSIKCRSDEAPKAVALADSYIRELAKKHGLELEETDKLSWL